MATEVARTGLMTELISVGAPPPDSPVRMPFPQLVRVQLLSQPSPFTVFASSHCSPHALSTMPSPQVCVVPWQRPLVHTSLMVQTLPSLGCGAQVLAHATERCAQAQSHNHDILVWGESRLIAWSHTQASGRGDYLWWELAAGGISCLGIHALLASAADAATVERDSLGVDAAYFPPICALSALLDSLADYHSDADTANHRFVSHYRDGGHAAERLTAIAADARDAVKRLRHSRRHAIILAGISSYYLSSRSVEEGFPAAAAQSLIRSVGPLAVPMRAVMRLRRRLHARRPRYSWRASLAGAREASRPGKTSTMSAAPTTAPTVSSICGIEVENGAGKPLTSRR
jgi:hypothetical protein